jgi:hypothetical protein
VLLGQEIINTGAFALRVIFHLHRISSFWVKRSDIEASIRCGLKRVHLSIPVSEVQIAAKFHDLWRVMLQQLQDAMKFALDQGLSVSVGGEDSSRAHSTFCRMWQLRQRNGGHSAFGFVTQWVFSIP